MEKNGLRTFSSKNFKNGPVKYINISKESVQPKANIFMRNLELKTCRNFFINKNNIQFKDDKTDKKIFDFKNLKPFYTQDSSKQGSNLQSYLLCKLKNNNETSKKFISINHKNSTKIKLSSQSNVLKKEMPKNSEIQSHLTLYKLYKKDFYSKLKDDTKFNSFHPFNKNKALIKSTENSEKIIPKNFNYKNPTKLNLSFDNSIIEGENNFSMISLISDISLGDQETMSSEKSAYTKMEKIKNQLKSSKDVFNLIKFMD